MFSTNELKTYALNKDDFISVSVDVSKVVTKKDNTKANVAPKEIQSKKPTKDIDVEDLFSDVWTKDIKKIKQKPVNSKRIKEIQKRIKTSKKNDVESISEKFNTLKDAQKSDQNTKTSSGNEVNEYLAKINALVYQHFNPPQNSQGNTVTAVIELSALGKLLDFRILSYSSSESLNQECDKIKARLMRVVFPINPNNKSSRTTVLLKSEE
jgi:periplasmic protein TonB